MRWNSGCTSPCLGRHLPGAHAHSIDQDTYTPCTGCAVVGAGKSSSHHTPCTGCAVVGAGKSSPHRTPCNGCAVVCADKMSSIASSPASACQPSSQRRAGMEPNAILIAFEHRYRIEMLCICHCCLLWTDVWFRLAIVSTATIRDQDSELQFITVRSLSVNDHEFYG